MNVSLVYYYAVSIGFEVTVEHSHSHVVKGTQQMNCELSRVLDLDFFWLLQIYRQESNCRLRRDRQIDKLTDNLFKL